MVPGLGNKSYGAELPIPFFFIPIYPPRYLEIVTSLGDKSYVVDYHLDNLLVFPPKTQLYDHPLVKVAKN